MEDFPRAVGMSRGVGERRHPGRKAGAPRELYAGGSSLGNSSLARVSDVRRPVDDGDEVRELHLLGSGDSFTSPPQTFVKTFHKKSSINHPFA